MEEARQFGFSQIMSEAAEMARVKLALSLLVILVIAGGYSLLDLVGSKVGSVPSLLVTIFGQYHFTEQLLPEQLAEGQRNRRYGSLFGAGLLSGLGVFVGSLLLLLPGLFLLARWELATPFVVCQNLRATEALRASWKATAKSWLPIAGVLVVLVVFLAALVFGSIVALLALGISEDSPMLSVPINMIVGLYSVGGWIIAAAIYRLAVATSGNLPEIFA